MTTTTSAVYEIERQRVRETHELSATVYLLPGGEPMSFIKRHEEFQFQPRTLRLGWFWNENEGDWTLNSVYVSGPRLNKNGTVNARMIYEGKSFLDGAGVLFDSTPDQFLQLIAELAPTSKVTREIR